ncbi:hypothetical protein Tco_0720311 [Tanacetum coccineum]
MFKRRLNTAVQASVINVQMMSDHNSSDLAPQRQEMSVENVSSGLVPQGHKASDYDNSDPVPPRQNDAPFLNVQMTSVHISSGLVLHQMTSDHNVTELGIQDTTLKVQFQSWFQKVFLSNKKLHHGQRVGITIPPSHSNAEDKQYLPLHFISDHESKKTWRERDENRER